MRIIGPPFQLYMTGELQSGSYILGNSILEYGIFINLISKKYYSPPSISNIYLSFVFMPCLKVLSELCSISTPACISIFCTLIWRQSLKSSLNHTVKEICTLILTLSTNLADPKSNIFVQENEWIPSKWPIQYMDRSIFLYSSFREFLAWTGHKEKPTHTGTVNDLYTYM